MSSLRGRMPAAGGGDGPGGISGSSIDASTGATPFGAVAASTACTSRGTLGGPAPFARRRRSVPAMVLLGRFSGSVPMLLKLLKDGPATRGAR